MKNRCTLDVLSESIAKGIEFLTRIELESASEFADWPQVLSKLHLLSQEVTSATGAAVKMAYEEGGMSWEKIGNELGMTRQAAWERFGGNK